MYAKNILRANTAKRGGLRILGAFSLAFSTLGGAPSEARFSVVGLTRDPVRDRSAEARKQVRAIVRTGPSCATGPTTTYAPAVADLFALSNEREPA